jgi:integrase/recombinase XerD
MTGVAFLVQVTLRRPEIADQIEYIAEPQKIPLVLSPEEVRRLLDAAPGFKCRLLLSLAYGCGLRASEVVSLKVCDIDSAQMVIRSEAELPPVPYFHVVYTLPAPIADIA